MSELQLRRLLRKEMQGHRDGDVSQVRVQSPGVADR